jgi:hypothetical protein
MKKTFLTAAVVALGLAGAAGPALAQSGPGGQWHPGYPGNSGPNVEFSLQFGSDKNFHRHRVLTNTQLRFRLRAQGYHDIRILNRNRLTVTVRAEDWRNRDYILTVNAYNGRVLSRQALFRPGPWPRPGFGFGFNFQG